MKHVMLDIETLGKGPYAPIISIGAVVFDPETGIVDTDNGFHYKIEKKIASFERIPDQSTLDWWAKQPIEAQRAVQEGATENIRGVLEAFFHWFPTDACIWGNGPTFDVTILETLLTQYGITVPWLYYNVRCVRTIAHRAKPRVTKRNVPFTGMAHDALADAVHQAQYVSKMWQVCKP